MFRNIGYPSRFCSSLSVQCVLPANTASLRLKRFMSSQVNPRKRKRDHPHPYLSGNFAPVHQIYPLTPCTFTGTIPDELHGGEYVRNGGNPVSNEDLGRDAHWFDGDGMLSGVAFKRTSNGVVPEFVNQYILTDVFLSSKVSKQLRRPILPSIATLVNPVTTLYTIVLNIFRTVFLVLLSRLPGSLQPIKKMSVANTGILFHDGRALATCESGPPMRVSLPGLETVGWYNGKKAEGESGGEDGAGFGGEGLFGFMREWTTAHPRVDPKTEELILFHSTFVRPYVHYSIIPATHRPKELITPLEQPSRLLNAPIPGISSAKMMHDFGVSFAHTVIMDLPLSLDPMNLAKNQPVVAYNPNSVSRYGVFPRHRPDKVRWFETQACCIFHTANTWDDSYTNKVTKEEETSAVNMLACRLTSASLVFAAGDVAVPTATEPTVGQEPEQCRLYYYQFDMSPSNPANNIIYQFGLSAIPFEFPSIREDAAMAETKYVYGCSTSEGSFSAALGRSVKIDSLVKIDAQTLIKRGRKDKTLKPVVGCVDERDLDEVIASNDVDDPIRVFRLPHGCFAQEPRFVGRKNGRREDDGWLLTYIFDESQLDENGECGPNAKSELWIIDAIDMKTIVGKVQLPARVTYGLHGTFVEERKILNQRPVETIRGMHELMEQHEENLWTAARSRIERWLG